MISLFFFILFWFEKYKSTKPYSSFIANYHPNFIFGRFVYTCKMSTSFWATVNLTVCFFFSVLFTIVSLPWMVFFSFGVHFLFFLFFNNNISLFIICWIISIAFRAQVLYCCQILSSTSFDWNFDYYYFIFGSFEKHNHDSIMSVFFSLSHFFH